MRDVSAGRKQWAADRRQQTVGSKQSVQCGDGQRDDPEGAFTHPLIPSLREG